MNPIGLYRNLICGPHHHLFPEWTRIIWDEFGAFEAPNSNIPLWTWFSPLTIQNDELLRSNKRMQFFPSWQGDTVHAHGGAMKCDDMTLRKFDERFLHTNTMTRACNRAFGFHSSVAAKIWKRFANEVHVMRPISTETNKQANKRASRPDRNTNEN